jgi:hypothetical protein
MILSTWRFIFLHAPKTGGNAMQLLLQPYSDDRLVVGAERDGRDRFGVRGPITPHKHATLQEYADAMGGDLEGWRIVLTARDPLARAVSHYFSPHRWVKHGGADGPQVKTPVWDRRAFLDMLADMRSLVDFVTVDGLVRRPDHLIRQERLVEDFTAFVRAAGVPADAAALHRVNASVGEASLREEAMADPVVRKAVAGRFAADYELLAAFPSEAGLGPQEAVAMHGIRAGETVTRSAAMPLRSAQPTRALSPKST